MNKITKKYSITIDGNDLDAKAVQKLKADESLKISRIADGEDTYEMAISTQADKMLDLLAYCDSIGIAPFIDDGSVTVESAVVDKVVLKQGKSRAKDKTTLFFDVQYSYDETVLAPCTGEGGIMGFIPNDDVVLATAIHHVINSGEDVVMQQPYLNMFNTQIPVKEEHRDLFSVEFDDADHNFYCMVLFDEKFTKCRVSAKIINTATNEELEIPLDENEKQSALTFVNHTRIFNGEEPVDCVIE